MGSVNDLRVVSGQVATVETNDNTKIVSLTDGATVNWDVAQGANAVLMMDHNLPSRTIALPYNIVSGQKYSLTLIQDKVGGAAVTFGTGVTAVGAVNSVPIYKTTIIFVCQGSAPNLTLSSITTSYSVDQNQVA